MEQVIMKGTKYKLKNRRVFMSKYDGGYRLKFQTLSTEETPPAITEHRKGKVWDTYINLSFEAMACLADYFYKHNKISSGKK